MGDVPAILVAALAMALLAWRAGIPLRTTAAATP
jgi:hypothetical protein